MQQRGPSSARSRGSSKPAQPAAAAESGWGSLPAELIELVATNLSFQER